MFVQLLTLGVAGASLGAPTWASAAEVRGAELVEVSVPKADYLKRHALVIGNSAYQKAPLVNPVNDARAMQSVLARSGFDVIALENASQVQMHEAIVRFGDRLRDGGVGLFYFAGHGVQVKNRNFLMPVDVTITREEEVQYKAVDAGEVLDTLGAAKNPLNIIILDACRSNPFPRSTRSAEMGLAQMEAPVGAMVAFATAPGAQAQDGQGKNGVYTQHLLKYILEPGLKVEDVFKHVRVDVRRATNGAQIPWESTSLEGDFYFVAPPATNGSSGPNVPTDQKTLSLEFWRAIKDSSNAYDYKAYLARFPNGEFEPLARQRLTALTTPQPANQSGRPSNFSFSRAEEEAKREWDEAHASVGLVPCSSARRRTPIKADLTEQLLGGMATAPSRLAAQAIVAKLRQAGLTIVTSGVAKYRLQGMITSQAMSNRRLALNEVSVNAAMTLTDASGALLSSTVQREESYAGNDLASVYAGLVDLQAAHVAVQIAKDFCGPA